MRLKNIIVTNLVHERLVAYEELEFIMNSKGDVENQVFKIKKLLKKITNITMMLDEWESINNSQEPRKYHQLKSEIQSSNNELKENELKENG